MQAINKQGYRADCLEVRVFSSICNSAAEISTILNEFITLFAYLDMKVPWPEVYHFKPAVSVVGVNGRKSTTGLENVSRIFQELWVLVSSSVSYCPQPGDGSG